ncbi:hypothetical protein HY285_02415 [Candidatus Peregrinibacteria bacterium]|nr:hypothetical protein [Candidatus Peregrinibacteria bacterium]MBI3816375.1 hypothetical protein [Candidatus Peregrinibacteria bacterium]
MASSNLASLMAQHKNLSEEAQKRAGKAISGDMDDPHKQFLKTIAALIESKSIDYHLPETLLEKDIYERLSEGARAKVDVALLNIADMLRHVEQFYRSTATPDESPHLQTMIEHLWSMKERVEREHGNVFKF